jgi:hypothetical protein
MLVVLIGGCMPAGAEFGGGGGGQYTIPEDMVPDPAYRPRVGDRAVLYGSEEGRILERLPLLKDLTAYDIYVRSLQAKDEERLFELEQQGWIQWAMPGTRLTVLALQDRNHTSAHMASQIQVVGEQNRNQTYWTPADFINRLIRKEPQ